MADSYRMPLQPERSTADLVKDIIDLLQDMIRSEVRLAKAEIKEEAIDGGKALSLLAGGALLCLYSIGLFLLACVYGLSVLMPPALAALIVSVVAGAGAAVLGYYGKARLKMVKPPEKTIESIKENVEWAKNQMR